MARAVNDEGAEISGRQEKSSFNIRYFFLLQELSFVPVCLKARGGGRSRRDACCKKPGRVPMLQGGV